MINEAAAERLPLRQILRNTWDHGRGYLRVVGVSALLISPLAACDPDGPGSLPDIPVDLGAEPLRAASTNGVEETPEERWLWAEQNHNVAKYVNYTKMLDAMHRFAANERSATVEDGGWFFPWYEYAEKVTGVPKEVVMMVHGMESTFARVINDTDSWQGPMQMGVREFQTYSAGITLPPEFGMKDRHNIYYAIPAGAAYLQALGANPSDPASIENALYRYSGGSRSYARTIMDYAYQAGYGS